MIRRILYLLLVTILLGGLAGAIAFYAFDFKPKMIAGFIQNAPRPPETVSAEPARTEEWQPQVAAIGTLVASEGIDVTPQVGGIVEEIKFESGDTVKKGQLLVKLDITTEAADMRSIASQLANAETELARKEKLVSKGISPRAELDNLRTTKDTLQASMDRLRAIVAQKFIYAPWDGQVGLRSVSVGSYLAPGQKIVWLQKTDPIYADFKVTEADFGRIRDGLTVTTTYNAYPGETFSGKIVTTDARVSDESRMITVRAGIDNPEGKLVPGMYANVLVDSGTPETVVTVPETAVTYSLYGDNVFVVNPTKGKDKDGKEVDELVIERRFVKAGGVRDGRVQIVSGLAEGDKVVTAGHNKIDQGSKVVIDNSIALKLQDNTTIQ
ncbi:MAG: efflux RND transporter periplasmic adaptor subunit [Alphaproteobacteria bacterium]|nr:efflux RND transporter periplasmic adaptor subunit [Alphaproteobacteria bacterium]